MIKQILALFSIYEVHFVDDSSQETVKRTWARVGHLRGWDWDDLGCKLDVEDGMSLWCKIDGRGFHVSPRCTSKDFDYYP